MFYLPAHFPDKVSLDLVYSHKFRAYGMDHTFKQNGYRCCQSLRRTVFSIYLKYSLSYLIPVMLRHSAVHHAHETLLSTEKISNTSRSMINRKGYSYKPTGRYKHYRSSRLPLCRNISGLHGEESGRKTLPPILGVHSKHMLESERSESLL